MAGASCNARSYSSIGGATIGQAIAPGWIATRLGHDWAVGWSMRDDDEVRCARMEVVRARRQASLLARPGLHCCRAKWKWLEDVRLMQLGRAQANGWSVQ